MGGYICGKRGLNVTSLGKKLEHYLCGNYTSMRKKLERYVCKVLRLRLCKSVWNVIYVRKEVTSVLQRYVCKNVMELKRLERYVFEKKVWEVTSVGKRFE